MGKETPCPDAGMGCEATGAAPAAEGMPWTGAGAARVTTCPLPRGGKKAAAAAIMMMDRPSLWAGLTPEV